MVAIGLVLLLARPRVRRFDLVQSATRSFHGEGRACLLLAKAAASCGRECCSVPDWSDGPGIAGLRRYLDWVVPWGKATLERCSQVALPRASPKGRGRGRGRGEGKEAEARRLAREAISEHHGVMIVYKDELENIRSMA